MARLTRGGSRSESEVRNRANQSRVLDPKPSDLPIIAEAGKTAWRTEPTRVENLGDELWVGVKGQSNSVIADFPKCI